MLALTLTLTLTLTDNPDPYYAPDRFLAACGRKETNKKGLNINMLYRVDRGFSLYAEQHFPLGPYGAESDILMQHAQLFSLPFLYNSSNTICNTNHLLWRERERERERESQH
jgi:hypothetical protein